jgi:hypothetical protein
MNRAAKLLLRIAAGLTAFALIGALLYVTNAFVGNPVSAMMADRAIRQYVDQHYSSLHLETDKVKYNFKDGTYWATARSTTSIDTKFRIYYRNGKVIRDDYEGDVLGKFNTLERLSLEYSRLAQNIVADELGYENRTMVTYDMDAAENAADWLELDMKFDQSLPLKAEVTLRLELGDTSLANIAQIFTDAHRAFVEHDCHFHQYGLYSEHDGKDVMVHGVTPADIESGDLVRLLEEAQNNDREGGIRVRIKTPKTG